LGEGLLSLGDYAPGNPVGIMKMAQHSLDALEYVTNISNLTSYEIGYDLGYVSEKVVETVAVSAATAAVVSGVRMMTVAAKGSSRAFWSGAGSEASALSKGYQTLGQTRAGQNLAKLTADMPYYPSSQAYNMWARLSTTYTKGAKGTVHVFQNAQHGVGMKSIWRLYEYPALKANPNVTNIIFHY